MFGRAVISISWEKCSPLAGAGICASAMPPGDASRPGTAASERAALNASSKSQQENERRTRFCFF